MICLLALLFLSTELLAQPVEGPWEIRTSTHMMTQPEVCVRGSNADLLFIEDDSVRYARFSLTTHQLVAGPMAMLALPGWHTQELHDLIRVNDSTWACLVYEDQRPYMPGDSNLMRNRMILLHGGDETFSIVPLDSGADHNYFPQMGDHYSEGFSLATRVGGGVVAAWITSTFWSYDYSVSFNVFAMDGQFGVEYSRLGGIGLWNNSGNRAVVRSEGIDSFVVVTSLPEYGLELCIVTDSTEYPDCFPGFGCAFDIVRDFGLTRSGMGRALVCDDVFPCVPRTISLGFQGGFLECIDLGLIDLASGIHSSLWHPDYGFAVAHASPNSVQLARVDTNGEQFLPTGTLAWNDGEFEISSANVTITDSGKIVAVWTQAGILDTTFFRVSLASVGWDTPLSAVPDPERTAVRRYTLNTYPNPFNADLTINYELPQRARVDLAIYNLLGEQVAGLKSGWEESGSHTVHWRPEVSSGIYFARLSASASTVMKKVVYLR